MALDPIHAFYCRKDYLDLAQRCKTASGGQCAKCGKIFDISELRPHHIIELTLDNIDNPQITLNPTNIAVLCHSCHNEEHKRFGNTISTKHVFIIHGSPFAGKKTYVKNIATRNDIIVDLDAIHHALCISEPHDKPDATKSIAFTIRDLLLDHIRTATMRRKWQDAFIIGAYPDKFERERLAKEYGAELIHIDTSKDECIKRIYEAELSPSLKDAATGWVQDYFARYRE